MGAENRVPSSSFVDAADRIARYVSGSAIWHQDRCTWQVLTPVYPKREGTRTARTIASGTLYQGTAGIALFLLELWRVVQEHTFRVVAEAALRYAIDEGAKLPTASFGFHSGRVGIAYVAARAAALFRDEGYAAAATTLLEPLLSASEQDETPDVIGGSAGAIAPLLIMAESLGDPRCRLLACSLGDMLIQRARREPIGWSWDGHYPSTAVRNLTGLAHGASGYAYGLLELFAATGERAYAYAAQQALIYERHFFDAERGNWPDFRRRPLADYLLEGRYEELRNILSAGGELPPYEASAMLAWCHGAPGIGLTRLRAYSLLDDGTCRVEADAAIETTRVALGSHELNYSLCHGHAGNCELLLAGAHQLHEPTLREPVETLATAALDRFGTRPDRWPCGTLTGEHDASLMLGVAGIGYFLLRLADSDCPSILFPTIGGKEVKPTAEDRVSELVNAYACEYFGNTIEALKRVSSGDYDTDIFATQRYSMVELSADLLRRTEEYGAEGCVRAIYELERKRLDRILGVTDFTEEFVEQLSMRDDSVATVEQVCWELSPHAEILVCEYQWESWLNDPSCPKAQRTPCYYLLYRRLNHIHLRKLGSLAYHILSALQKPRNLEELNTLLISSSSVLASTDERERLRVATIAQIEAALRHDLVRRCVP